MDNTQIVLKLGERHAYLKKEKHEKADEIQADILAAFRDNMSAYECDFIIETLTHFGWAPQVIYDDNGHFAITTAGYAPVPDGLIEGAFTAFVMKNQWAESIREALEIFLKLEVTNDL